jgi:hemerythrin-like domain-containing protein
VLRASAAELATATGEPADPARTKALQRWYRGFAGEIRCHHHIEDELLFPALAARVATYGEHAARLEGDHAELDEVLDDLEAALDRGDLGAAAPLAIALRDHLDEHLGYEDDEIAPLFARHFTAVEFDELNSRAVRMTPPRQLLFTAPWLLAGVDQEEQARILASVPKALHLLWFATRRRYARLAERALGTAR